jgi:pilus assembly protein CpaB
VTRRRRAAVLLGLALLLGSLAASDVAGREAALRRSVGPAVSVVVVREAVPAGGRLTARRLGVRRVPARFAPASAYRAPSDVEGLRAAVPLQAGADLEPALVDDGTGTGPDGARGGLGVGGPALRPGERVAQIVAVAPPEAAAPGSRVDVLVTREGEGAGGATELALQDVEVLSAAPAGAGAGEGPADGLPRTTLGLRVTLRQAVYLAAAQAFARELRVLARAAGDRRRSAAGVSVGEGLQARARPGVAAAR